MRNTSPTSHDSEDTQLAIRCQLGDREAWDELVRRWNPRLWRFVSGMLSEGRAAEDVLQTVWLRVVRSFARLRNPEQLAGWLFRIARVAVVDHLRKQYRQPPADRTADVSAVSNPEPFPDGLEVSEHVARGLSRLHPIDREAVVLHYFDELSLVEVAAVVGVPEGTIKSRLFRARSQLREVLSEEEST